MQQNNNKTLVQCDFDGTLTEEDTSFLILDAFADGDWRSILKLYKDNKISVGQFNTLAFRMVKANEKTLTSFINEKSQLRPNFTELLNYCRNRGFLFFIVSNGLTFYIRTLLNNVGVNNVDIFAAHANFIDTGIETKYIGPDGKEIRDGFKEAYIRHFLKKDHRVISIGNGASDMPAARLAHFAFATEPMLSLCKDGGVDCMPFDDLKDIIKGLESL
ncbi:MAG: HAD-IB family phosphatase [Dehalococcoidales bacterium]|nr:HAD-IB family phosphatase [Dehalococcoidales bacterium]